MGFIYLFIYLFFFYIKVVGLGGRYDGVKRFANAFHLYLTTLTS